MKKHAEYMRRNQSHRNNPKLALDDLADDLAEIENPLSFATRQPLSCAVLQSSQQSRKAVAALQSHVKKKGGAK